MAGAGWDGLCCLAASAQQSLQELELCCRLLVQGFQDFCEFEEAWSGRGFGCCFTEPGRFSEHALPSHVQLEINETRREIVLSLIFLFFCRMCLAFSVQRKTPAKYCPHGYFMLLPVFSSFYN